MLHIGAKVARPRDTQDGIHVGAIEVHEAPSLVKEIGDFANLLLEQAKRIRIRNHKDRRAVIELPSKIC